METKQVTSDKNKRLIDAMQIVTRLSKRISVLILLGGTPAEVYDEVLKVIAEAPTEDAAPVVHGEWIEFLTGQNSSGYECSICKRTVTVVSDIDLRERVLAKKYPHCNCGAKMEKCENTVPKPEEECD